MSNASGKYVKPNNFLSRLGEAALELLFPSDVACAACDCEAITDENGLCTACREKLGLIEHACIRCGRPLEQDGRCRECARVVHSFTQCISVCRYEHTAADMVKRLKFAGKRYIARSMARIMAERLKTAKWRPQAIVPVPMYPADQRKRGYNQTECIARELSRLTGLPVVCAIRKTKQTDTQVGLDRAARLANLKGAFAVDEKHDISGKRVILLDDVYTTGATMDECSRVLREAGTGDIYAFSFATGRGK